MARTRDKITHFYFGINYKVVWSVVKKELPTVEPAIARILSELKKAEKGKRLINRTIQQDEPDSLSGKKCPFVRRRLRFP
jgi:hypothetical protein